MLWGGVPAWSWGGACLVSGGCLVLRGCLPGPKGGVPAWSGGGIPSCTEADPPCEQNHRCLWKYYLAPTSLRAVISAPPIDSDVTFVVLCPRVVNVTRLILCPRVVNVTRLFFWPRGFSGGASPRGWTTGAITIRSARSPRSAETAVNTAASPNVS